MESFVVQLKKSSLAVQAKTGFQFHTLKKAIALQMYFSLFLTLDTTPYIALLQEWIDVH